jgi:hypothetical protein
MRRCPNVLCVDVSFDKGDKEGEEKAKKHFLGAWDKTCTWKLSIIRFDYNWTDLTQCKRLARLLETSFESMILHTADEENHDYLK